MKLCGLLLLMLSLQSIAEVYTWINEDGVRVYGDEPPEDAQKADLPDLLKLKTLKIPEAKKPTSANEEEPESDFKGYSQLVISSPQIDQVISAGDANSIAVQLQISPALQAGHKISLLLDGKQVDSGTQLNFQLQNVTRGSHLLQVKVKHRGRLLISSPQRRIHVQRPSILNRSSGR